jgi:hypothetical protein
MKDKTIRAIISGWKGFMITNCININRTLNTERVALVELSELERLAEIGRATEKAFEYGAIEVQNEIGIYDGIEEFLKWYKAQETTYETL